MSNAYKYKSYFIMAIQQNLKNTVVYLRSKLEKKTKQNNTKTVGKQIVINLMLSCCLFWGKQIKKNVK